MLRILCIHGYRQNGDSFKDKLGAFRKIVKKHAELVFITAPLKVPPLEGEPLDADAQEVSSLGQCGWWFSREDNFFRAQDESHCCPGFEESLKAVEEAFIELGPFDGILGFSQGAALVAILCGMQEQQKLDFKFEFAILVAGFKSHSAPHDEWYKKTVAIPTLHVYGESDKVIEKEMSEDLLQYFHEPVVLIHPGGHFVPASGPQKQVYLKFLGDMKELPL